MATVGREAQREGNDVTHILLDLDPNTQIFTHNLHLKTRKPQL